MAQHISLVNRGLLKNGKDAGTIREQLTELHTCTFHPSCHGPVVRVEWADGRLRKECLYQLLKDEGFALKE